MSGEWVRCEVCDGEDGYVDDDGEWWPCEECDGDGGHVEGDT